MMLNKSWSVWILTHPLSHLDAQLKFSWRTAFLLVPSGIKNENFLSTTRFFHVYSFWCEFVAHKPRISLLRFVGAVADPRGPKFFYYKKVLLRERKRHTAWRIASARYADLSNGWVGGWGYPIQSWWGVPWVPPATIQTWLRGYPLIQTWDGVPPTQTWDRVPPTQTSDGVPSPTQTSDGVPFPSPQVWTDWKYYFFSFGCGR